MKKHDAGELRDMQALPLEEKISLTKRRIIDWSDHFRGNIFVSFSGGKDSTVLLDLVRETLCDDSIPAVFANTGLEYAQIQRFVQDTPNAEIVRPRMRFDEVISTYGYPIISFETRGGERQSNAASCLVSTGCGRELAREPPSDPAGKNARSRDDWSNWRRRCL